MVVVSPFVGGIWGFDLPRSGEIRSKLSTRQTTNEDQDKRKTKYEGNAIFVGLDVFVVLYQSPKMIV